MDSRQGKKIEFKMTLRRAKPTKNQTHHGREKTNEGEGRSNDKKEGGCGKFGEKRERVKDGEPRASNFEHRPSGGDSGRRHRIVTSKKMPRVC